MSDEDTCSERAYAVTGANLLSGKQVQVGVGAGRVGVGPMVLCR